LADPFVEAGYPSLHDSASAASLKAQRRFLIAFGIRLGGLLSSTIGGAIFFAVGASVIGGWIAVVGFAAALLVELFLALDRADRKWYEGRAAAESAKTLAWRYSVRGESFEDSLVQPDLDRVFVERINEVTRDLKDLELEPDGSDSQITDQMRTARAAGFETRKALYRDGRIEDQRSWYVKKAAYNLRRSRQWLVGILVAEGFGLIAGILTVAALLPLDILGLFAAVAATATAWIQAKQHSNLATAYGITAQELAGVKAELVNVDEARWSRFVGQAEEAISREHTLWRASRGIRLLTPKATP